MQTIHCAAANHGGSQFGLFGLMTFVTICAVLSAFAGTMGIASGFFLATMALALGAGRGSLAIVAFAAASMTADLSFPLAHDNGIVRQVTVILLGASICIWFRLRRGWLKQLVPTAALRPQSGTGKIST